jgi:hypothetical protein
MAEVTEITGAAGKVIFLADFLLQNGGSLPLPREGDG